MFDNVLLNKMIIITYLHTRCGSYYVIMILKHSIYITTLQSLNNTTHIITSEI